MSTLNAFCASMLFISTTMVTSGPFAQDYPTRAITFVVAFPAGGNADLRARMLGVPISKMLGKPVVVDNKPGAAGNIGHAAVARAQPDGYTVGIAAMGPMSVNPSLYASSLGFDPKDLVPVVLVERAPLVLVTRADKPYKTLADFISAAKANPGGIAVGNAGSGGAHHLSAKALEKAAVISVLSVPYKGGGPASLALLTGEIEGMFEQTYAALPSIQAGKTRALAVTSAQRLPSLPNVPTMAELGFPQITISNWVGVVVPNGTPKAIIATLNESFNKALAMPEIRDQIVTPGNEIGGGTPEAFGELIASDSKRWAALVKDAAIKVD